MEYVKKRLIEDEKSELYTNCIQLKMKAKDRKLRETDTLDTKGILRLIESVPSPNEMELILTSLSEEATKRIVKKTKTTRIRRKYKSSS